MTNDLNIAKKSDYLTLMEQGQIVFSETINEALNNENCVNYLEEASKSEKQHNVEQNGNNFSDPFEPGMRFSISCQSLHGTSKTHESESSEGEVKDREFDVDLSKMVIEL